LTSDFVSLVEYFGSLDKWPLSSTELTNIKVCKY
jgi:hypothetical protein